MDGFRYVVGVSTFTIGGNEFNWMEMWKLEITTDEKSTDFANNISVSPGTILV